MATQSDANRKMSRLEEIDAKMAEMRAMLDKMPFSIAQMLGISLNDEPTVAVFKAFDLGEATEYMAKCSKIIVIVGAGISTSAGIPDYRSPGTGLYSQLEKDNLPSPEVISSLEYFRENPDLFFERYKPLYINDYKPTPAHYFIRVLCEKGKLLRVFTQNIDSLEQIAGVPPEKVVQAHGTILTAHCLKCDKEYSSTYIRKNIIENQVPYCEQCDGIIKPDIILFGESLPKRFSDLAATDFPECDFLIIMGTSLQVAPFNMLITRVTKTCPRLLINIEPAGEFLLSWNLIADSLKFNSKDNSRDVFHKSTCDEGAIQMAKLLNWQNDLDELIQNKNTQEAQATCVSAKIKQSKSKEAETARVKSPTRQSNSKNRSVSPRKVAHSGKPPFKPTCSSTENRRKIKTEQK